MSEVTLHRDLRATLNGLHEPIEIRDEAGKLLGMYLPLEEYRKLLYRGVEIPLTADEIQRRRQQKGGIPLHEFWKRMGQE
jgi:hypothetical protein